MKLKEYLLIALLTLISPILTGYYFGVLDHDHYLPYLNKLLNPALYPNDYFFSQPHVQYSWFDNIIVFISQNLNLNLAWTHLLLYLISLFIFYLSIYLLAKTFYHQVSVAVLAIIFLILPKWASQIGYMTHHYYFVSRDLSLGLSLLALNFILVKKNKLSILFLIIAFIVNPSIPIPVMMLLPLSLRKFNLAIFPVDSSWLQSLQQRGTYSFPHLWNWTGWGTLVYYYSLLGISWLVLKQKLFGKYRSILNKFIIICSGLFVFHLLISSVFPIPQLIQLQLLRSVNYIFILALIAMAGTITELLKKSHLIVKIMAIIAAFSLHFWSLHLTIWHILLVWLLPVAWWLFPRKKNYRLFKSLPLIVAGSILFISVSSQLIIKPIVKLPLYWYYPNPLISLDTFGNWRQVQLWAKSNTAPSAVFLVPPQWSGFRSFSERGIVADAKDGGAVFYSAAYSHSWQERMDALTNYQYFSEADFINLNRFYPFNYIIVTSAHQPLNFESVYQNQQFSIYKL